ncbi:class I ribonucleotide reductase maintenance protein YfaE [Martelella alba]|uniref:2Fe-2S ferredoxin-like protein n=1 Tax=Martelella alba TaxID=2590451 RepID=A0ABY2SJM0_9HYPH|nr:class I ribonucleotide reductase maintenance protein YfaE [Martelella alba]TKI04783.1 2Fe-2S ferredoxin-like protein [Martelella alba]
MNETPKVMLRLLGTQLSCEAGHRSLLDVLEANRIPVEFQCRSGYCGSCRLRLVRGEVRYSQPPLACLRPGDILPCCCLPAGDIELDV